MEERGLNFIESALVIGFSILFGTSIQPISDIIPSFFIVVGVVLIIFAGVLYYVDYRSSVVLLFEGGIVMISVSIPTIIPTSYAAYAAAGSLIGLISILLYNSIRSYRD
jgi:hypothetical protein